MRWPVVSPFEWLPRVRPLSPVAGRRPNRHAASDTRFVVAVRLSVADRHIDRKSAKIANKCYDALRMVNVRTYS